jgi:hypothetical protein
VIGEVQARLPARVLRLNPARRVATVALRSVGRGAIAGAYAGRDGSLAPVANAFTSRYVGRAIKVAPTTSGAEIDLVIADADAWQALATGTARVDALFAFAGSAAGDPVDGRPVRVEVG